jgi:protein O-GlcNAc transferase
LDVQTRDIQRVTNRNLRHIRWRVATQQQIGQYLIYGEQALARGQLSLADLCGAMVTHDAPENPAAWNLYGRVALSARRADVARRFFDRALAIDPTFKFAIKNRKIADALDRSFGSARRFLVIREWGAGFWSDVGFVVAGCLLARITGREPLVWWGDTSLFRRAGDTTSNAWEQYFEPVGTARIADVAGLPVWPPKWAGDASGPMLNRYAGSDSRLTGVHHMSRDEPVCVFDFYHDIYLMRHWLVDADPLLGCSATQIVRSLTRDIVRPRPEFIEEAARFAGSHLGPGSIALHLRGLDKPGEIGAELAESHERALARADGLLAASPNAKVLVLTDDADVLARVRAKYTGRLIMTDVIRASGDTGLHISRQHDGYQLGREVLLDALIATHASHFIGLAGSNVSYYIAAMKDWGASCDLYGTSLHENFGISSATLSA